MFRLSQIMLQFTKSQSGKRILIFDEEKFNEVRLIKKASEQFGDNQKDLASIY